MVGPASQRLFIAGDSFVEAVELSPLIAEIEIGVGEARLDLQRLPVARNRFVRASCIAQCITQIIQESWLIGVERECATIQPDRLDGLALAPQDGPGIVERTCKLALGGHMARLDLERMLEAADGRIQLIELAMGTADDERDRGGFGKSEGERGALGDHILEHTPIMGSDKRSDLVIHGMADIWRGYCGSAGAFAGFAARFWRTQRTLFSARLASRLVIACSTFAAFSSSDTGSPPFSEAFFAS